MANNKKGGFSKTQAKLLQKNIDSEVAKVQKAIKALDKDLEILQKGNGEIAYWSGERAYSWIKNALDHVANDKVLLEHLDNCNEYLESLVRGGSAL